MIRALLVFAFLLSSSFAWLSDEKQLERPAYDYDVARAHEIKPHSRTIPLKGVQPGFN